MAKVTTVGQWKGGQGNDQIGETTPKTTIRTITEGIGSNPTTEVLEA